MKLVIELVFKLIKIYARAVFQEMMVFRQVHRKQNVKGHSI